MQLKDYFESNFKGAKYTQEDGNYNKLRFAKKIDTILKTYDPHLGFSFSADIIRENAACLQEEGRFSW